MSINFEETPLIEQFGALYPQQTIFTAKPSSTGKMIKLYLPVAFVEHNQLKKGQTVYITFDQTHDYMFLEEPTEFYPFKKGVNIQGASRNSLFLYLPKRLINRYKNQLGRVVLTETKRGEFNLTFYAP